MDEFLILVRAVHLASSATVAGGIMFIHLVARPAFGPAEARAYERPIRWWLLGNLLIAIASSAGWLILVGAHMAERPVFEALADGTIWIALTQTQFGLVWQLRILAAGLLVGIILSRNRYSSRWAVVLGPTLAALYMGLLAWTGHAGAAAGSQGAVHLGADFLHLVAAGAWLGGLPPLALLLRTIQNDTRSAELAYRVTRRFSDFGVLSVTALLASGLINSWFLVGSMGALIGTDYGMTLLVKIVLFLAMVSFAAANRLRHLPRLSSGGGTYQAPDALRQLRRNTIAEIAIGLGVIVIVGALGVMMPASHATLHAH